MFAQHPHRIAREAANAEALRAAGLNPALATEFDGQLVHPGDLGDNVGSGLGTCNGVVPFMTVYCETYSDVDSCLRLAKSKRKPFVCRSGGHSTACYSTINDGIVLDMSRFKAMAVSDLPGGPVGTFGPGLAKAPLHVDRYVAGHPHMH